MFQIFEKLERRPFSEARPKETIFETNELLKNPFSIRPDLRINSNNFAIGKRFTTQSSQSNHSTQLIQPAQLRQSLQHIQNIQNLQSKTKSEFPTFPTKSLRNDQPKKRNSIPQRSSQEFYKPFEFSSSIRNTNLNIMKPNKNYETERIQFLQKKMTANNFFPKKNILKSQLLSQNDSINFLKNSSSDFFVEKDLENNPSKAFMKELEDKEKEENERDQSYEIEHSKNSLENIKSNEILLLSSIYQNRPPTIFFKYPKICGKMQDLSRVFKLNEEEIKQYDFNCRISNDAPLKCVQLSFTSGGFEITTKGKNWNFFWGFVKPETLKTMNQYQKTNHFPGCWHLGRKDNLYRHVLRMKQKFPEHFDFIPKTYLLSSEYKRFLIIRQNSDKKSLWIMKPCNQACGRGVKVIDKKSKIDFKKDYLISEYIDNPHLINELKYDLRIYVLITSFDPLRVYFYKEGLVRFATEKYSLSKKKIKKRYVHLTNYSVNKKAMKYKINLNSSNDGEGSKWSFSAYKKKLSEMEIDSEVLFQKIHDLIIKVCISVEPFMLNSINKLSDHRNNCFELYGFDILIDKELKPWLVEVNVSPSLSSSSPLDAKIKTTLISDILNLIGLKIYDRKKLIETGKGKSLNEEKKSFGSNTVNNITELNSKNCLKKLSTENWNVLFENEEEFDRRGEFERIFPKKENIDYFSQFFDTPTINNLVWWKLLKSEKNFLELICKKDKK